MASDSLTNDWLIATYLILSGAVIVVGRRHLKRWQAHLYARAILLIAIGALARTAADAVPAWHFIRSWYTLPLLLILYWEIPAVGQLVHRGYFDDVVGWRERRLFGGATNRGRIALSQSIVVSELLHFCYCSYLLVVTFLPIMLYAQQRWDAFAEVAFAEVFTVVACLVIYLFFPVAGPRYLAARIEGPAARGGLCKLTHWMLERTAAKGTALPSLHVTLTVVVVAYTARYATELTPWVSLLGVGIVISTVYGRFHYAVDALAGAVVAAVIVLVTSALHSCLRP